jgi:ADP-heptose:LPS heptosyltransferase
LERVGGEGTYLEPDQEFGRGWVEAVASAADPGTAEGRHSRRRRIQVHRQAALGDVLLITPVLKALRYKYPEDEIVVTTEYPDLILGNPFVDRVVKSATPLAGFDHTFNLEYERWPNEHIVEAYARIVQVPVDDRTPEIYLSRDERATAVDLLHDADVDPHERFCVMQITSGWRVRDWPPDRFKEVAEALEQQGVRIVVLGQTADPPIDFGVDLRGRTTVREAAAVIEKCALMVTIDSLLMHIGYAFRRPVVSLFGCTDPEKRVPEWALPSALYGEVVCQGCHHRQRPLPAIVAPKCLWETLRCMEALSCESVIAAARAELARAGQPLVSIVIPHYTDFSLVDLCLSSIYRSGARVRFEVIVVTDGSPDDSAERLQVWRPQARIVNLEVNQGFSRACNAGAQAARGKYVVFLNNDTEATPGWLDELVSFVEADPRVGIAGPKLLYPDSDTIQHCGTVFNEQGLGENIYRLLPLISNRRTAPKATRSTGSPPAGCRQQFRIWSGLRRQPLNGSSRSGTPIHAVPTACLAICALFTWYGRRARSTIRLPG